MILGILLYAVVMGFFNDYTAILHTSSYSITFAVAVVMQILTYLTFAIKDIVAKPFKAKEGARNKFGLVFTVWFVMFTSKFVFLGVIDAIFNEVEISGFIGLIIIIATMTITHQLLLWVHRKLVS